MNLRIVPVTPDVRDAILKLSVCSDQLKFTALPSTSLPIAETDPKQIPMAILEGQKLLVFLS